MWKVASADNRLIFYCVCTKFITQFASKINCHGLSWWSVRGNKKTATTLISSRTGKTYFLNLFVQISDGFERLSAARRVQWSLLGQQEIVYWLLCRDYPPAPCRWKGGTLYFVLSLNVKSSHFPYYWFYMTSLKFKLKNYQSYWFFTFMKH